jgi:hypothetical protein
MRCQWLAAAIAAISLAMVSAKTSSAGVVVAETSTAHGPDGQTYSVDKTIYTQGNKQKVEKQGISAVTDLDKSIIYIIDRNRRVYAEVPLQAPSPAQQGKMPPETIQLSKTGKTRVIADQPCDEYRKVEASKMERVTISACVSTGAPGAEDVSKFERKMAARFSGGDSERYADDKTASLMLDKQSILSFRVPDPSGGQAYRTASLLTETRVNKIQLKPLPPETFKPPKGYSKLSVRPHQTAPPDTPEAPDQTVETAAQDLPIGS